MKFKIALTDNTVNIMRRAGYAFQKHVDGGEMAFVRRLANGEFPRFHIYAKEEGFGALIVSIHLDAKGETHGAASTHAGEYDTDGALGPEVERLKKLWTVID